jgi:hypothetical protein
LLDLSKIFALSRTPEHTKTIYNLALNYGANPAEKIKNSQPVKNAEIMADNSKNYVFYVIFGAVFLTAIASIFIIIRKRKLQ